MEQVVGLEPNYFEYPRLTYLEQVVGFEPTPRAWQAHVLTTNTIPALVFLTAGAVLDSIKALAIRKWSWISDLN